MVNDIIFGISEQCRLKFKTALFTNCKRYIILLFRGARFLFLLLFSFSFPSLSSTFHSCSESLQPLLCFLSLPLPLLDILPPSPTKPRPEHQGKLISIAMVFFFLVCDLMLNSAVVMWVMDLAFWVVVWCALGILWIWVRGSTFVNYRRDWCGSLSWPTLIVGLIGLIGVGHWEGERERERQWDQKERMKKIKTKKE